MPKAMDKSGKKKGTKKITCKYLVDCRLPIEDNVIVLKDFESYLKQNIKVDSKKGNLGSSITVGTDKESLVVESKIPLSNRYKWLTKKYLKKQELKEFLRVIATIKSTYQLKYFN